MRPQSVVLHPDALLTEKDAAELLKLSMRTLQAWRQRKVGPAFVRAGRAIRYRNSDLADWMALNTVLVTPPLHNGSA